MKDKWKELWIYKTETAKWKAKKWVIDIPNFIIVLLHFCLGFVSGVAIKLLKWWIIGYCCVWVLGILNDIGWLRIQPYQALTFEMHLENIWNVFRWWCEMSILKWLVFSGYNIVFDWIYKQFDKVYAHIDKTSNDNYYRRIEKANINLGQFAPEGNEVVNP